MNGKVRVTDNAHIELFFRTIKYDQLYLAPNTNCTHLYQQCPEFIDYYNQGRGHSSHKYETQNYVYQKFASASTSIRSHDFPPETLFN